MTCSFRLGTIVLVHGAWADGSCWSNIILPLKRERFDVVAAQIPLTSLTDDAAALRRVIERTAGPVILVGHAYAGAVIAEVDHDRVRSLVYIAALAPKEGETVADVFYRAAPHEEAPRLEPDAHGFIWMPEDSFGRAVAHNASPDQIAIMAAVQRPIAVQCIQEAASVPTWTKTPSWYLIAEEDRMIIPDSQRFMADRMGAIARPRQVDHTPMYSQPAAVTEVIVEAARKTLSI